MFHLLMIGALPVIHDSEVSLLNAVVVNPDHGNGIPFLFPQFTIQLILCLFTVHTETLNYII